MSDSMNSSGRSCPVQSAPAFRTIPGRISAREMSMCLFGSGGTCCRNCNMGPCKIIDGMQDMIGVCGATADTVAARNFARIVGAGVARQMAEARKAGYTGEFMPVGEGVPRDLSWLQENLP